MNCSAEEQAQTERFESLYLRSQSPVILSIERRVCGCDYGGNSWTTRAEAEQIVARLGLQPGVGLLDLGAGCGWPGLYIGKRSGCDVVLVDLPLAGLRIAAQRAKKEAIAERVWTITGDAAALPFAVASFDAISHSDLLCCLKQKRSVLASCRQAIRRHGRMAFTVISVAPGLSDTQHRRAVANGPPFIESSTDYPTLLAQTDWVMIERQDISAAYAASCRRQLDADQAYKHDLIKLIGADEFAERVAGWRSKLAAIGDRLLRREFFVATPSVE